MAAGERGSGAEGKPFCFVIGPIGPSASPVRKHADLLLNAIIKAVLEEDEFGYVVKRADDDADPGMIGDRIITHIVNADVVIADLTDLNPNVFYELGIRHSIEKPTIHIAKVNTVLPFDTMAQRTIFIDVTEWNSIQEARARLAESVRTIRKPNYKVSNPITQANASFKARNDEPSYGFGYPRGAFPFGFPAADPRAILAQKRSQELIATLRGSLISLRHKQASVEETESELRRVAAQLGVALTNLDIKENTVVFETSDGGKASFSTDQHERHESWTKNR